MNAMLIPNHDAMLLAGADDGSSEDQLRAAEWLYNHAEYGTTDLQVAECAVQIMGRAALLAALEHWLDFTNVDLTEIARRMQR